MGRTSTQLERSRWRTAACVACAIWACATSVSAREHGFLAAGETRSAGNTACGPDRASKRNKRDEQKQKRKEAAEARRDARQQRVRERKQRADERSASKSKRGKRASEKNTSSESQRANEPLPDIEPAAAARRTPAASDVEDEGALTPSDESSPESDSQIAVESDCSTPDAEPCPDRRFSATLAAYAGFTTRGIRLPTLSGLSTFETGFLPSLGLQLALRSTGDPFYAFSVNYQSSVGAEATQPASDPQKPALSTGIHTHHFDAGVFSGLHLGAPRESAAIGLYVGYGVRALASVVELRVPRYSLHGPVARLEFELPLGTPNVVLRIAPEVQCAMFISRDLASFGVAVPIWAFGGEAGLRVSFSNRVSLQIAFRESHATASKSYGASFQDVERFGLLGFVVDYL